MEIVTFIMPAYNAEKFISKSIQSLLNQNSDAWKLICIDDGSTDNTLDIIQKYCESDKRISIIQQENKGPAVARALAISKVQTKYLAIFDSDDLLSKDYVLKVLSKAKETDADIIMPDVHIIDEKDNIISKTSHFINNNINPNTTITNNLNAFQLSITWRLHGWILMKTDFAQIYYTENDVSYSKFNSDEFITRKLYLKAKSVAFTSATYYYRNNNYSLTRTRSLKHFDALLTYEKLISLCEIEHIWPSIMHIIFKRYRSCINLMSYINKLEFNNQKKDFIASSYLFYKKHFNYNILKEVSFIEKIKYHISLLGFNIINGIATIKYIIAKLGRSINS